MNYTIDAVYENGFLKPLAKLKLPEHILVHIAIFENEPSSMDIAKLAQESGAFDFWNNPEDDIYDLDDGEKAD